MCPPGLSDDLPVVPCKASCTSCSKIISTCLSSFNISAFSKVCQSKVSRVSVNGRSGLLNDAFCIASSYVALFRRPNSVRVPGLPYQDKGFAVLQVIPRSSKAHEWRRLANMHLCPPWFQVPRAISRVIVVGPCTDVQSVCETLTKLAHQIGSGRCSSLGRRATFHIVWGEAASAQIVTAHAVICTGRCP